MKLQERIRLLVQLNDYLLSGEESWQQAKEKAGRENPFFIPEFIENACTQVSHSYLQREILENWMRDQPAFHSSPAPRTIGIVMAGNIPLVGFHDWLSVFISGHRAMVKPSSKDRVLLTHLVEKMGAWNEEINSQTVFSEMLKGCDAYIATGSNRSSRYFEYYFGKYPHIIRRNKTSVAILSGRETPGELEKLADDVYLYFGLGCRNVTKVYVPEGYDFVPMLDRFKKYNHLAHHHKYKDNYDYNLALHILNKNFYMTNGTVLLVESRALFSPLSQVNYEFYGDREKLEASLIYEKDLQCIIGEGHIPFGQSQSPAITDYADGVNTLDFLAGL